MERARKEIPLEKKCAFNTKGRGERTGNCVHRHHGNEKKSNNGVGTLQGMGTEGWIAQDEREWAESISAGWQHCGKKKHINTSPIASVRSAQGEEQSSGGRVRKAGTHHRWFNVLGLPHSALPWAGAPQCEFLLCKSPKIWRAQKLARSASGTGHLRLRFCQIGTPDDGRSSR
jgi:hypothetical protein